MPITKVSAFAHVTASSLKLLTDKDIEPLSFSKESFDELEVIDPENFKQSVVSYLAKLSVKKKTVTILLSQEVLFQQSIPLTEMEEVKKQSDSFFKELPLEDEELAKKTLTNDKEVYLIATNKILFSLIKEAFEATGWTVEAILPATLFFGFSKDGNITKRDVETIYKSEALYQAANFLSLADGSIMDESKDQKSNKKFLKIAGVLAILIILGFFLKSAVQSPMFQKPAPTPTAKPTEAPTPTPTITAKDKGLIKIQILNGSGTPGQAGQVKNSIVQLGYTSSNITTDNADSSDHKGTTAEFGASVSKDERDEIVKTLKNTFTDVSEKDSSSANYDIIITTGR